MLLFRVHSVKLGPLHSLSVRMLVAFNSYLKLLRPLQDLLGQLTRISDLVPLSLFMYATTVELSGFFFSTLSSWLIADKLRLELGI